MSHVDRDRETPVDSDQNLIDEALPLGWHKKEAVQPLVGKFVGEPYAEDGAAAQGRYLIQKSLGSGGSGAVYEVLDRKLGRQSALKFLRPDLVQNPAFVAELKREVDIQGKLFHPGIIRVYDFLAETEFGPAIVLEKEESPTLEKQILMGKIFPPTEIAKIVQDLLQTLQFLHAKRIRHGDLTPANIFLNPTFTRILDFGKSHYYGKHRQGYVVGNPEYLPPEYLAGEVVSSEKNQHLEVLNNVFGLGAIIYEMMTNYQLFDDLNRDDLESYVASTRKFHFTLSAHPSIGKYIARYRLDAHAVELFFQKSLAGQKAQRYQTFEEFEQGLVAALTPTSPENLNVINPTKDSLAGQLRLKVSQQLTGS